MIDSTINMFNFFTPVFVGPLPITGIDLSVCLIILLFMATLGWQQGDHIKSQEEYFFGKKVGHTLALVGALISAQISILTIIGVTTSSFQNNWNYLSTTIGTLLGGIFVSLYVLPKLHHQARTVHEDFGQRFGPITATSTAGAFIVSRLLISSLRLYSVCAVVSLMTGLSPGVALVILTVLCLIAVSRGGLQSVIWTSFYQSVMIVVISVLCLYFLRRSTGGMLTAFSLAQSMGKMAFVTAPVPFVTSISIGFLTAVAFLSVDYEIAQKYMVVRDLLQRRIVVIGASMGVALIFVLYLAIGSLLFVFYKLNPGMALAEGGEKILIHYSLTSMPVIMRGMILSMLIMSSIDLPLNSLSAIFIYNIANPILNWMRVKMNDLMLARASTVAFAGLIAVLATILAILPQAASMALESTMAFVGPMLGIFLFGKTTRRKADFTTFLAYLAVVIINFQCIILSERGELSFALNAMILWSSFGSYLLAYLFSLKIR